VFDPPHATKLSQRVPALAKIRSLMYLMPAARKVSGSGWEETFCSKTKFCGSSRV
jgi:hypothetical protein